LYRVQGKQGFRKYYYHIVTWIISVNYYVNYVPMW